MAAVLRVGLTGRMASGKGEAARLLVQRGFRYISLSDIVRREAARLPVAPSRAGMQDIGNRLRTEGGAGVLGRLVREEVEASGVPRWVIDGIRNPEEVRELRRLRAFFLVAVDSPPETILRRMRQRGRSGDTAGEAELRRALEREWGLGEPAGGQQVGPTMALADFTVGNDGTLAEFQARLEAVLDKIGAAHG